MVVTKTMKVKSIVQLGASLLLGVLIGSCQGTTRPRQNQVLPVTTDDPGLTGAVKVVKDPYEQLSHLVPYTGSGNVEPMRDLRDQVNQKYFNPELGRQLTYAQIHLINDTAGIPKSIQIKIGYRPVTGGLVRDIEFESPITKQSNGRLGHPNVLMKNPEQFTGTHFLLSAVCFTESCKSLQLFLKQIDYANQKNGTAKVLGETGILYSREETIVRVRDNPNSASAFKPIIDSTSSTTPTRAIQESVEILEGPSYVRVHIPSKEEGKNILVLEGELLRTTDMTTNLKQTTVNGQPFEGVLLGNNEAGDIAIRIKAPPSKPGDKDQDVTVFFEKEQSQVPPPQPEFTVVDKDIWASQPTAVIPVNFSNPKLAHAQKVTRQMEKFRINANVGKFIKYWTTDTRYPGCEGRGGPAVGKGRAIEFFHKISALVPYTHTTFEALDATPEFMYISALESRFAVSEGWPIEASGCTGRGCSSAVGPYQLLNGATKDIKAFLNFNHFPLQADRKVNPEDDRGIFLPATFAGAKYAKTLMEEFPEHPELWPLGYYLGKGNLASAMKCIADKTHASWKECEANTSAGKAHLQRSRYQSTTLDEIVHFKMAPCEKIDYTLAYLALKFVGANLAQFNITLDPEKIPKDLPRLYRKGQNAENLVQTMMK